MRFWWGGGRRKIRSWTYLVCAYVASRPWSVGAFAIVGVRAGIDHSLL